MDAVKPGSKRRPFSDAEVVEIMRLFRDECLCYAQIAILMARNTSSIGYLIRREDMREEERMRAGDDSDIATALARRRGFRP